MGRAGGGGGGGGGGVHAISEKIRINCLRIIGLSLKLRFVTSHTWRHRDRLGQREF